MKENLTAKTRCGQVSRGHCGPATAIILCAICILLVMPATSLAFEIETDSDWNIHVNGYMDLEYTYMSTMPMFMNMGMGGGMFENMPVNHELAQEHLNILLGLENGPFRAHFNFESIKSFSTGREDWDKQHLLEGYGEYTFDDSFRLRAGKFLAPFGIYNDIRYLTPLFATVVLPFMYESPSNYSGTPLTPPPATAMVSGQYWGDDWDFYYAFYIGTEDKTEQHINAQDNAESLGGRVKATFNEDLTLGFSAYTVKDQSTRGIRKVTVMGNPSLEKFNIESPREFVWGADLQYDLGDNLRLLAEVARSDLENLRSRISYYFRLEKEIGRWTPFVAYDTYDDDDDPIYRAKGNRYGVGVGYRINDNTYLKGEYHFHDFTKDQRLRTGTTSVSDTSHMVRLSLIYAF